jgi:signal transduction histidine kinase
VRTLFAKFLLWFWLALAVMLGAEVALETASLREGLGLHPEGASGRFALHADLARELLARSGPAELDSLLRRFESHGGLTTYCIDSAGTTLGHREAPRIAREAARAALRSGRGTLIEGAGGIFVGYPLGRSDGRLLALVLHPSGKGAGGLPGGAGEGSGDEPGWASPLPYDLGVRALAWLVLGGLGCYLLARYITAPVARLRHATRRLAAGDLGARVGPGRHRRRDELEDLGRDFDLMAERLEKLVSAQRRLLRDISHELRSPLARMNVALGLLRQREADDPDGMLARLETEADRLNRLIGDLLTLSRVESGESGPRDLPLDLGALAAEIADDARFEAGAHGCEVRLSRTGPVPAVGELGLLRSAVENVVRNAVRHTAAGTAVEITVGSRAEAGGPVGVIEVRDHGPGLPADQLERIFEPFYRADDSRQRGSGGTGLGLAIARRAVAQHGGSIEAAAAPGGGLRVTIRLPAAPARA